MRDFYGEYPYLRGLTPEQQSAFGRYLLSRRGAGADGGNPVDMPGQVLAVGYSPDTGELQPAGLDAPSRDVQLADAGGAPMSAPGGSAGRVSGDSGSRGSSPGRGSSPSIGTPGRGGGAPASTPRDSAAGKTPPASETPATNVPPRPDRQSLESIFGTPGYSPYTYSPNAPMPVGPPFRSPPNMVSQTIEARKAGYSDSEIAGYLAKHDPIQAAIQARDAGPGPTDEEILNHLKRPQPPSIAGQIFGGARDALSTIRDWVETRGNRTIGSAIGAPREILDNSVTRWLMPSVIPYVREYLPTGDEATNYIRRHGGFFPTGVPFEERWKARREGREQPLPPETNLPGLWGKTVDGAVEGLLGAALLRNLRKPPSYLPPVVGGGKAFLREVDRREQVRRAEPRPQVSFGDVFQR